MVTPEVAATFPRVNAHGSDYEMEGRIIGVFRKWERDLSRARSGEVVLSYRYIVQFVDTGMLHIMSPMQVTVL